VYSPSKNRKYDLTLEQVRKELPRGKWKHNRLFEDISVAAEFGMSPMTFWMHQDQDKAFMVAYQRAVSTMRSYEDYLHAKEMERQSRKKR
jgi:hypothetical protein